MSDSKKKDQLSDDLDLDFSSLDGGTVQKEQENIDLPDITNEHKAVTNLLEQDDIFLAVPKGSSWEVKDIHNITGEEFIAWVKNSSFLVQSTWNPDPKAFDGPENVMKRIDWFERVAVKHVDRLIRNLHQKGIAFKDLIH